MRMIPSILASSAMILAVVATGCADLQGPVPPRVAANDAFAAFQFTTDAMFIAQGQTLQLSLHAIAADDSSIPVVLQEVIWSMSDSARIDVDSLGRITGKVVSSAPVTVRAKYTYGVISKVAVLTVYVSETAGETSPTSVKLIALDSTRVGYGIGGLFESMLPKLRVDLYDGETAILQGVQIPLTVPSMLSATYSATGGPNGEAVYVVRNLGLFVGKAWIKASVNLYGTEVQDSVEFQGTYPVWAAVAVGVGRDADGNLSLGDTNAGIIRMAPCGIIVIQAIVSQSLDLVFSDSLADPNGCASLPTEVVSRFVYLLGRGFDERIQVGGNVLGMNGIVVGLRRSATNGEVSWYVRDAVTKKRLLGPVQYINVQAQ